MRTTRNDTLEKTYVPLRELILQKRTYILLVALIGRFASANDVLNKKQVIVPKILAFSAPARGRNFNNLFTT